MHLVPGWDLRDRVRSAFSSFAGEARCPPQPAKLAAGVLKCADLGCRRHKQCRVQLVRCRDLPDGIRSAMTLHADARWHAVCSCADSSHGNVEVAWDADVHVSLWIEHHRGDCTVTNVQILCWKFWCWMTYQPSPFSGPVQTVHFWVTHSMGLDERAIS